LKNWYKKKFPMIEKEQLDIHYPQLFKGA
jgi:hypothetical protein